MPNNPHSGWEYKSFPSYSQVLPGRAKTLLRELRSGHLAGVDVCCDNRPQHCYFFEGLTPIGHEYFAGHYRGENYSGLKHYDVGIDGDSRVGVRCDLVVKTMQHFAIEIRSSINILQTANQQHQSHLTGVQRLLYIVRVACKYFVEFLRIHPYANGNGHMGRFMIFGFLSVFGVWPKKWPLNDRPPDPPYSGLISRYRDGDCEPLEKFVFRCVLGQ